MSTGTTTIFSFTHVTGLSISSDAGADGFLGYYKSTDVVEFSVSFSDVVTVIGSPILQINVGGEVRTARLLGGSGTDTLIFGYTIGDDNDSSGVSVPANSLKSNGALIRDPQGRFFDLSTPALTDAIDHRVDVVRPGTPTMNAIAGDFYITADEVAAVQITGTAESGSTIELAFDSGFSRKILVPTDGNWGYLVTEADLQTMGLGREYVTATVTDAAGNAAVYQTQSTIIVEALSALEASPLITGPGGVTGQATLEVHLDENTRRVLAFSADQPVIWSLAGGPDQSRFIVDPLAGELQFNETQDFEQPQDVGADNRYVVVLLATSASGQATTLEVTMAVDDINDSAPQITSASLVHYLENGTGPAYVVLAADADSIGSVVYSMTGVDEGQLQIDAMTGVVSFLSAPDFEIPRDADGDNRYDIVVTASDGVQTSMPMAVGIVIGDDVEGNQGSSAAPRIQSVALDNQISVDVRTRIVVDFDQDVHAVAGRFLRIVDDGGTGFHGENIVNTQILEVTDSRVTLVGSRLLIDPEFDLDFSSNYHVEIENGAFLGSASALAFAGVSDSTTINFATVSPAKGGVTGEASIIADESGAMVESLRWWDLAGLGNPFGAARALSASGGDSAFVAADYVTAAAAPEYGYDGVGVSNFNVTIHQFTIGDLLYVDNRGANTSVNATAGTVMIDNLTFTDLLWEGASSFGGFGGQVQINGLGFETVAGWQMAMGANAAPYVIA